MSRNTICHIIYRVLTQERLPGTAAQLIMSPDSPGHRQYLSPALSAETRKAGVLILLTPPAESPRLPLILRSDDGGIHAGQIAFPGGSHEQGEVFPVETALREAREEIGLDTGKVDILGVLSPLYIPASNFSVTPVVGCAKGDLELKPDGVEAKAIVWLDLAALVDAPLTGEFYSRSRGRISAPYYPTEGGRIWGATAMMLSELAEILKNRDLLSPL